MKNLDTVRERYLRDPLPVRLGGLAANLSRIASFARNPATAGGVRACHSGWDREVSSYGSCRKKSGLGGPLGMRPKPRVSWR